MKCQVEVFNSLLGGCSWEDYVLDAILAGEGNPFAEASANIGNLKSMWSSHGVPASLQAAAASDLDALQRLSITESTLSGWVLRVQPSSSMEFNDFFGFSLHPLFCCARGLHMCKLG
jgi:hypothetical protein